MTVTLSFGDTPYTESFPAPTVFGQRQLSKMLQPDELYASLSRNRVNHIYEEIGFEGKSNQELTPDDSDNGLAIRCDQKYVFGSYSCDLVALAAAVAAANPAFACGDNSQQNNYSCSSMDLSSSPVTLSDQGTQTFWSDNDNIGPPSKETRPLLKLIGESLLTLRNSLLYGSSSPGQRNQNGCPVSRNWSNRMHENLSIWCSDRGDQLKLKDCNATELTDAELHVLAELQATELAGQIGNKKRSRRPALKKVGKMRLAENKSSGTVFQLSLEQIVSNDKLLQIRQQNGLQESHSYERHVPHLMLDTFEYLRRYGMHLEGLFRIGTSQKRVERLKEDYDLKRQLTACDPDAAGLYTAHDVGAVLKLFLRDLTDPLIPSDFYRAFLNAAGIPDLGTRLQRLNSLLLLLSPVRLCTLYALVCFLREVVEQSDDLILDNGSMIPGNKMHVHNLSVVFAPNILRESTVVRNFQVEHQNYLQEKELVIGCIEDIIEHPTICFTVPIELQSKVLLELQRKGHLDELDEALSYRIALRRQRAENPFYRDYHRQTVGEAVTQLQHQRQQIFRFKSNQSR